MNKGMLPKLKDSCVRIEPPLRELGRERRGDPPRNVEFWVEDASKERLSLRDHDSGILLHVNADHVYKLDTDISRRDGRRHWILSLNVQFCLDGDDLMIRPLRRQERVAAGADIAL